MKKTTILLGMLSLGFAYAQQVVPTGKVGVNTQTPKETLDVQGTAKVQDLPTAGANKIYNGAGTKGAAFTPTKTVVADNNGVLGVVEHIVEAGTSTNTALQWSEAEKKWKAVVPTATGVSQNDEAWKKVATDSRVTNNDDAFGIYRNTNIGIGSFSSGGDELRSPLHIKKPNVVNGVYRFGTFQVSDKTHSEVGLASILEFTDSASQRYAMIGDNDATKKLFELKAENGYELNLTSTGTDSKDKAFVALYGGGTGDNNEVKIKFNSGRWGNDVNKYGVTTVSKNGNWRFGADFRNENTPADQKVVIDGALRFNGSAYTGLSHNSTNVNDVTLEGTMFYNNGHFFGVITEGGTKKWKQLDNTDNAAYTGDKGINVSGNTISLPDGGGTAGNGKVLTWNGTTWAAATPVDNDTKSPWALLNGTPASSANNASNTDINFKGRVGIGSGVQPTESIDVNGTARLRNVPSIGRDTSKVLLVNNNGVVKHLVGTANGQVLTWSNGGWDPKPIPAVRDTNTNIYTDNGTISADRTVTLSNAKIDWNGGNGFNISRTGETLSLKAQGATQANYIGFYRNGGDTRTAYFGFDSANNSDLTIKNELNGNKIVLANQTKINDIPEHAGATYVLVDNGGVVSKKAISSLTTSAPATEPWFVTGGNTQATNTNNTNGNNIYYKGAVGIGDFGASKGDVTQLGTLNTAAKQTVKLAVKGAVLAGSFKGAHGAHIFPDYVFQKYYTGTSSIKADYTFKSLSQVEDFVKSNGHLPGYKSAADIKAQGYIDVMETQISNVEKIEELYLHTIEQEKALKEKDAKIKSLEERLERLEKLIK